jgi:trk system potassium uptake protein TrkH
MLTATLIVLGAAMFFILELPNPDTLGSKDLTVTGKILGGFFQSVTPRTAGFSAVNQNLLTPASKLVTMVLMFIGASPSGTGGGIKTTTFAILLLFAFSTITGRKEPRVFDRRLASDTIRRAVTITVLSLLLVGVAFLVMVTIEAHRGGMFTFENILFEVLSAFGTVGLSSGITPTLTAASRLVLVFVMFAGRVGFMTLVVALSSRNHKEEVNIRYPEARFMVG